MWRKRLETTYIPRKKPTKKPSRNSGTRAPTSAPMPAPRPAQTRFTVSSSIPAPATSLPVIGGRLLVMSVEAFQARKRGQTRRTLASREKTVLAEYRYLHHVADSRTARPCAPPRVAPSGGLWRLAPVGSGGARFSPGRQRGLGKLPFGPHRGDPGARQPKRPLVH